MVRFIMNQLARELNAQLEGTVVARLLSEYGMRSYFPKGIVAQSGEAKERAHRFNATVGMAYTHGEPAILPAAAELLEHFTPGEAVGYSPTAGNPRLRDLWAREIEKKNPSLKGAGRSRPVVTAGLTNGIFQLAELFADPGDHVVMPDMFWGNYRLILEGRNSARLGTFPFFTPEMTFNTEGLAEALRKHRETGKVILLLNFPTNPAGYAPTLDDADRIVEIIHEEAEAGTDILAVCDDAYFGLFYDDNVLTESLFARLASVHERVLAAKVDGATKEHHLWGVRVGFVTMAAKGLEERHYEAFEKKLTGSIRASISNSNTLGQNLLIKMLENPDYPAQQKAMFDDLHGRFRTLRRVLDTLADGAAITPLPCNAGYFVSLDCGDLDAEQLRLMLLDRGIGTISIQGRYLRVAFAAVDEPDIEPLFREIFDAAAQLEAAAKDTDA